MLLLVVGLRGLEVLEDEVVGLGLVARGHGRAGVVGDAARARRVEGLDDELRAREVLGARGVLSGLEDDLAAELVEVEDLGVLRAVLDAERRALLVEQDDADDTVAALMDAAGWEFPDKYV